MSNLLNTHILIRLHHDILTSVNAIQGDTGRLWYFQIEDYEVPSDAEIRMYIRKPSGKEIYNSGILQDNIISFQPTLQTLAEIGQSIGQIQILSNGLSVTTFPFFLNITENYRLSSSITSKDEFLILDELIEDARATLAEMKALIETVTTQETARIEAEKKRVSAENTRKTAETGRVTAENTRTSQENDRKSAENKRVTAETGRVNAENTRVSQENSRKFAESSRVTVESNRVNAEKTRVSQENSRKSAETKREESESTRQEKENERLSAEDLRKKAETSRVNAEKARVTAEASRVEAEKLRQQNTTTAINKANQAASNANSKATLANEAAVKADAAAKKATDVVADINIVAITSAQIDSLKNL